SARAASCSETAHTHSTPATTRAVVPACTNVVRWGEYLHVRKHHRMKPFIRGLGSALVVVTVGAVHSPAGVVLGKPALVAPINTPPKTSLPKINAANLKPTP